MSKSKAPFFLEVRSLINKYDPTGIGPGVDVPIDEYDIEIKPLIEYITYNHGEKPLSKDQLATELNRIWKDKLGQPCRNAELIATELCELIKTKL